MHWGGDGRGSLGRANLLYYLSNLWKSDDVDPNRGQRSDKGAMRGAKGHEQERWAGELSGSR